MFFMPKRCFCTRLKVDKMSVEGSKIILEHL